MSATGTGKLLRLLELVVVRTENDRHVPYRSLKHIVDADSKSASYVSHVTIFIYRGEKSEAVDDKHLGIL